MDKATPTPLFPSTRREFLQLSGRGLGLLAFSRFAPALLVNSARAAPRAPERDRSILVLVQLAGGNDGLNTLVPYEDANYYRLRPTLGIPKGKVLRVSDALGLHPSCAALHRLLQDGKLAVVQNVGYPNPNRSHSRSSEIWTTASNSHEFLATRWTERFLAHDHAGQAVTNGFRGNGRAAADCQPLATYPGNPFAALLRDVAARIAAGQPTRVYSVSLAGFDTHSHQANQHAYLLTTLSEGLAAFQQDLELHQLAGQVTTMTFSEFGRRPGENESRGTDHGTAAPLFVLGSRVKGGLYGKAPALDLAPNQDLTYSTDFRSVYATLLDRWLDCPSETILGGKFAELPIV